MRRRRWFETPLALQTTVLLVAGTLVGQVLAFGVILFMPPPPGPVYRLEEVAAALRKGASKTRFGRPLVRTTAPRPPVTPDDPHSPDERLRRMLARRLNVPVDDVRLDIREDFQRALRRRQFGGGPPGPGRGPGPGGPGPRPGQGRGEDPGPVAFRMSPDGPQQWRVEPPAPGERPPPRMVFAPDPGQPIVGDFVAALRTPSGDWVVVRPKPEPFPSAWQLRVIIWFFCCLLLLAPAGYLFARRMTAPLRAFARAADRLGRNPTGPPIHLRGPAEIGIAAATFNDMQARLKTYLEHRNTMVGALSHDMRAPLMRLRLIMERAPDDIRERVASEIAFMDQMITAVLDLARDDSRSEERVAVDLLSVLEKVAVQAGELGADVEVEGEDTLIVEGDPLALERLFGNLADNAAKYGERARLALFREREEAVVTVADNGPGLPEAELEKAFTPFYRAQTSRPGGVGLGLAVVRQIARAHGGDVRLANGVHGGLVATVRLPLHRV